MILLTLETRIVAYGNSVLLKSKLRHESSVIPYSTDNHRISQQAGGVNFNGFMGIK